LSPCTPLTMLYDTLRTKKRPKNCPQPLLPQRPTEQRSFCSPLSLIGPLAHLGFTSALRMDALHLGTALRRKPEPRFWTHHPATLRNAIEPRAPIPMARHKIETRRHHRANQTHLTLPPFLYSENRTTVPKIQRKRHACAAIPHAERLNTSFWLQPRQNAPSNQTEKPGHRR
jgi:hypothetical protein